MFLFKIFLPLVNFLILGFESWMINCQLSQSYTYHQNSSNISYNEVTISIIILSCILGLNVTGTVHNLTHNIKEGSKDFSKVFCSIVTMMLYLLTIGVTIPWLIEYTTLHDCLRLHNDETCNIYAKRLWDNSTFAELSLSLCFTNTMLSLLL